MHLSKRRGRGALTLEPETALSAVAVCIAIGEPSESPQSQFGQLVQPAFGARSAKVPNPQTVDRQRAGLESITAPKPCDLVEVLAQCSFACWVGFAHVEVNVPKGYKSRSNYAARQTLRNAASGPVDELAQHISGIPY